MTIKKLTDEELIRDYGETPESLDRLKRHAEYIEKTGELPPAKSTTIVVRRGRPAVFDEQLDMITWRAQRSQRELMDASVRKHGETRSDFMREAVNLLLQQRGELAHA